MGGWEACSGEYAVTKIWKQNHCGCGVDGMDCVDPLPIYTRLALSLYPLPAVACLRRLQSHGAITTPPLMAHRRIQERAGHIPAVAQNEPLKSFSLTHKRGGYGLEAHNNE